MAGWWVDGWAGGRDSSVELKMSIFHFMLCLKISFPYSRLSRIGQMGVEDFPAHVCFVFRVSQIKKYQNDISLREVGQFIGPEVRNNRFVSVIDISTSPNSNKDEDISVFRKEVILLSNTIYMSGNARYVSSCSYALPCSGFYWALVNET